MGTVSGWMSVLESKEDDEIKLIDFTLKALEKVLPELYGEFPGLEVIKAMTAGEEISRVSPKHKSKYRAICESNGGVTV